MAEWNANPTWTPLEQINGGQQFNPDDVLTPEDFNKLVENMQYLYANGGSFEVNPYPIGITIELYTNDSPAMLFGGDWTKVESGRVTISANGHTMAPTYNGETTGGSADAVLVKHNHTFEVIKGNSLKVNYNYATLNATGTTYNYPSVGTGAGGDSNGYIRLTESGVDGTDKNMQPWIAVHKWRRIG